MTSSRQVPALLLSAPGSGHGKTLVTAGLARYFRRQNKRVALFKVGPDFLDPLILSRAAGTKVKQLDLWMMGEDECRRLLYEGASQADVLLVEGVIGLYDGTPSSADFARLFNLPIATIVNARGMAQTVHAVAHGLAAYAPDLRFAGYVVNGANSSRHIQMIEEGEAKAPFLGVIPATEAARLPERHLGLHQAAEIADLDARLETLADLVAKTALVGAPQPTTFDSVSRGLLPASLKGCRIVCAFDEAFSFVYEENLEFLRALGADVLRFSPLNDAELPPCDAVFLPGGYPELHAARLSGNNSMIAGLRAHVAAGKPLYAECGGMLYLMEKLSTRDGEFAMCGLLPGHSEMTSKMQALGYQRFAWHGCEVRAHTFHYSRTSTPLQPLCTARKRMDETPGESVFRHGSIFASYLHLYFATVPELMSVLFVRNPSLPTPTKHDGPFSTARP